MNATASDWPVPADASEMTLSSLPLRPSANSSLVSVLTLVIWSGCVVVGIAGMALPYLRPQPPVKAAPPVNAELLSVDLTSDPLPPLNPTPPPPSLAQPPPAVPPPVMPPAQTMIAVAAPSPQIAFAVPIQAPVQIVTAKEASYRTVETPTVAVPPAPVAMPHPLTFGQGEGKQPAPEYPRQSLREGQEGTVTVRMTVGEDGRVLAAEASSPSPWPLLNTAALRVVKSRWRFSPGAVRLYEVAIRFQLNK